MIPGAEWDTDTGLLGHHTPLRLTVPGVPAAVTIVRRFVRSVLCGHPTRQDVELLVSEVATNAVRHTASGYGGRITVEVTAFDAALVHVTVIDDGAAADPGVRAKDALSGYEHGLLLVSAIAKQYGTWATGDNRACWFDVGV